MAARSITMLMRKSGFSITDCETLHSINTYTSMEGQ